MIQIYLPENTAFDKNGDMVLTPTEATVSAALNGEWTLEMEHPIDSEGRWKYIRDQAVIKAPSFNGEQLFRILTKKKNDESVSVTAEPIFMDARNDCFLTDVRPTDKNGQEALDILTGANSKYHGKSDIIKRSTAYYQDKNLIEALCGEDDNSFLRRWGGEILFDNFTVTINERVGGDYGVNLLYGKNLVRGGLEEDVDFSDVCTRIYPKAYNGHSLSGAGYVDSPLVNSYPTVKARTIKYEDIKMIEDAQEDDEENGVTVCSTQAELDAALRKKCEDEFAAGLDKPKVTISADMVLLENTKEYAEYKDLERVSLGDTVHLKHRRLGIVSDARVVSLTYDCVRKKVSSVVIGDFEENYFSNVSSVVNRVEGAIRPDGSLVAERVSGFISGAMAGLRAQYDVAEKQDVLAILFENLDESSELYGALGIGTQGVMISKERTEDGRSWKWTTALTANGLIADVVVAGLLSDKLGKNFWNLDTGEFSLSASATVDGKTVGQIAQAAVDAQTQEDVFKKLTDGGTVNGLFMENGQLYVNASYIKTGTLVLGGKGNARGRLRILDTSDAEIGRWDNGGIYINGGSIYCKSGDSEIDIYSGHEHIVYKGTDLGFMGGNGWAGLEDVRGINFDMNKDGAYMTWAARTGDTGNYIVKLLYANRSFGDYTAGNLYIECPLDAQNYAVKNAILTDCKVKNSFSVPNGTDFSVYADADWHGWSLKNAALDGCYVPRNGSFSLNNNVDFNVYTDADWHNWTISNVKFENIVAVGGYRPFTGTLTVVSRIENNSNGGITWYTANHTVQDGILLN